MASPTVPPPRERRIGHYRLLEQIGEGGFGVVYLAEQSGPIRRRVALKLIKPGMDSAQVLARFESERQALALMEHPHIARLHEGGLADDGRPFFAMELVEGLPMTEFCTRRNLPLRARLELFLKVCRAVHHAHQKGVIHRDLKPSNILVTMIDDEPVPKVIDFGVAKAIEQRLTERTLFTGYGQMIGTPEYMSPEQAAMSGIDADTRSDVYSLGALLYELISGRPPLDGARLRTAAYDEVVRIIRETQPPKPSTRSLRDTVTDTDTASGSAGRWGDGRARMLTDLDWITLKALEKERSRRYDSAGALADDIERHLADQPIVARPPSRLYSIRRFCRRHRTATLAAAGSALALLAATAISIAFAVRAHHAEHASRIAEAATRDHLVRLHIITGTRALEEADPWSALLWFRRAWELDDGSTRPEASHRLRIASVLTRCPSLEGLCLHASEVADASLNAAGDRMLTTIHGGREAFLWDPNGGELAAAPLAHDGLVAQAAFDASGVRAVTSGDDRTARIWNSVDGSPWDEPLRHPDAVHWSEFSHDGARLVTACADGVVRIWDLGHRGEAAREIRLAAPARYAAFSPDGTLVLTADESGTARLWSFPGLEPRGALPHEFHPGDPLDRIALPPRLSADQGTFATATGSEVHLLRLGDDRRDDFTLPATVNGATINADGSWFLYVGKTTTARVVRSDGSTGSTVPPDLELPHPREVQYGDIAPDGQRLVTSSSLGLVHVWDPSSGAPVVPPFRHIDTLQGLRFAPDGRRLVVASRDGSARLWNLSSRSAEPAPYRFQCGRSHLLPAATADDGPGAGRLRIVDPTGALEFRWHPGGRDGSIAGRGSREPGVAVRHSGPISRAAFTADGTRLMLAGESSAALHEVPIGTVAGCAIPFGSPLLAADTTTDGSRIALVHADGSADVWATATGERLLRIVAAGAAARDDDRTIALSFPPGHSALAPAGDRLAVAERGYGRDVHVIAVDSRERVAFSPAAGRIASITFDDAGQRVAIGSSSTIARVWDARTGEPLGPAIKHPKFVRLVAFGPEGRMLATVDSARVIRIWDWRTGDLLASVPGPPGAAIQGAWFSRDGGRIVVHDGAGNAREWAIPSFELDEDLVDPLLALLTGHRIDETGGVAILEPHTFRRNPDRFLEAWRAWRGEERRGRLAPGTTR